ncbi:hypothetical protein [Paraburkholderia kururiensis]|nr:hypothetical protein [Paraburkholderia kururiensis]
MTITKRFLSEKIQTKSEKNPFHAGRIKNAARWAAFGGVVKDRG